MSFFCGYRNGTHEGQSFTMPDEFHGVITEDDANRVADRLRKELGREPTWQKVRGQLIRLGRQRLEKRTA